MGQVNSAAQGAYLRYVMHRQALDDAHREHVHDNLERRRTSSRELPALPTLTSHSTLSDSSPSAPPLPPRSDPAHHPSRSAPSASSRTTADNLRLLMTAAAWKEQEEAEEALRTPPPAHSSTEPHTPGPFIVPPTEPPPVKRAKR